MKKIISVLIVGMMLFSGSAFAAWDATKPADSEKLKDTPALIRANWDAIATGTDAALLITNAKVSASAAIVDTKLATISTAGKVSGAALTSLGSVPAGGGQLPLANGGTGATSAATALTALLPTQTGNSGKSLVTDASSASWGYPASLTIASAAQGDVLFYNGTIWTRLGAGSSGQFLKTQGAGANPTWASQKALGTRSDSFTNTTVYQASTDGFLIVMGSATRVQVEVADNAGMSTNYYVPMDIGADAGYSGMNKSGTVPIPSGKYFRVDNSTEIHWIPFN